MTTTVYSKEGSPIVVTGETGHFPTGNPLKTLFVRDAASYGEVWIQTSIGKLVLPLPLKWFRTITRVDRKNPTAHIWDANAEKRAIVYTSLTP